MEEKDEVLEALKQTSESLKEEITRFDKILSISTIKEEWQSILQKKLDMKIALFCVKKSDGSMGNTPRGPGRGVKNETTNSCASV